MQYVASRVGAVLLGFVIMATAAADVQGQEAMISGFISDASSGEVLSGANIVLRSPDGAVTAGATTNDDGLYVLAGLEGGRYELSVSYVGYHAYIDTLQLEANEKRNLNVALIPAEVDLEEVTVEAEREGAATTGRQTIRPEDIDRVPTPDVTGDLASYLTTLPGVVALGDRGGQLFIRGGEPSQNLIMLDGMTLYQPFHALGFYSAFPSNIVRRAEVYAGGFGSRYGERISSVLDVRTRTGHKRQFAGSASISPFLGSLQMEGPIYPGRVSFLASTRQSLLEHGAEHLVEGELPFIFGDAFGKIHADLDARNKLSISMLGTYDRGTIREEIPESRPAEEVRWTNHAIGLRWLTLPHVVPASGDLHLAFSQHRTELGTREDPTRSSSVADLHALFDATYYGEDASLNLGMVARYVWLTSQLGGLHQNVVLESDEIPPFALYMEPEFAWGRWRLWPGVRMQIYNVKVNPFIEPRLRLTWRRGIHKLNGAVGRYHQELMGLSDRRDAASVFTAWSNVPRYLNIRDVPLPGFRQPRTNADIRAGREQNAWHALMGYEVHPTDGLSISMEGYYRHYRNLFVAEWTAVPRLTTELQPATGRTIGMDVRLEFQRHPYYVFVGYGLSSTRYEAGQESLELWYETNRFTFRPPHDRRHQLNVLANTDLWGFEVGMRWQLGSGLPFSRPIGFDGFNLLDEVEDVRDKASTRRVIYERPYNAVLPAYHRLDLSINRSFSVGAAEVTLQGSVINAYNRRNIFYMDMFTFRRVDQLPLVPSLGVKVAFDR